MSKQTIKGTFYVLFAGIFWGFMSILVNKLNNIGLKAMDIISLRVLVSSFAMVILILFSDKKAFYVKIKDLWCFLGTGVFSLTMFNFFYFSNIIMTSPGVACVLMYTSPFFIILISAFLFKEKIDKNKIIAAIIAFFGCFFVCGAFGETISLKGLCFGLMSGLGYGLYSIFGRLATDRGYSSITVSAYTFFFSVLGTAPFSDYPKIISCLSEESFLSLFFIIFMIIFFTVIPYMLYTQGLKYIQTGRAGVIAAIEVVSASLVGFFVFSESFTLEKIIGITLVILSIAIMNIKKNI